MKRTLRLDEEEEEEEVKVQQPIQIKKVRKSYSSCNRATKNGFRCLNMSKYKFKIGLDCYKFCIEHFEESFATLLNLLLTGDHIEFLQQNIKDEWVSKYAKRAGRIGSVTFINEDTKQVVGEIQFFNNGIFHFYGEENERKTFSSISELVHHRGLRLVKRYPISLELNFEIMDLDEMGDLAPFVFITDEWGMNIKVPIDDMTKFPTSRFMVGISILVHLDQND